MRSIVLPKGTCNGRSDYGAKDHLSYAEHVPFALVCCRCCVAVSMFCRPVFACCKGAMPFDRITDASGLLESACLPGSRRYAYSLTMFTARSTQQAPKSGKQSSHARKCACYMGACKGVVSMPRARAALCADESMRREAKPESLWAVRSVRTVQQVREPPGFSISCLPASGSCRMRQLGLGWHCSRLSLAHVASTVCVYK